MSLLQDKLTAGGARLLVEDIDRPSSFYAEALGLWPGEGEPGHLHWLVTRYLLALAIPGFTPDHLQKDEYGKPSLPQGPFLSITHSFQRAAVLLHETRPVALDLEKIDARIERVAHKFVNEQEASWLEQHPSRQLVLTLIWSAKETLYKQYGRKELDFRRHLLVEPQDFEWLGTVHKENFRESWPVHWEQMGEYVVTWID